MKCTNRKKRILITLLASAMLLTGCSQSSSATSDYEKNNYNQSLKTYDLFAADLCVTDTDVDLTGYTNDSSLHAAGLFDISRDKVLFADNLFEQIYPASTTKVMTAYIVLKYGNLDDEVTVSENAVTLSADAQVCGLKAGDKLTLGALLNGLILYSGNDNAIAIAEYMAGGIPEFADLMNKEALTLGATHSHFCNPHGLHEDDHYTTAYDLYLIFNACCKDQRFLDIISQTSYNATITDSAGEMRTQVWEPTNYYSLGTADMPDGVRVLGGKTGTTDDAGNCVILYSKNMTDEPYISVVMGAATKDILYQDTTDLLTTGIGTSSDTSQ
ncbi:MAG: serine hydrolase [Hespellia sp.]|nr:serine hydrolase [Hespellia sp.]